MNHARESSTPRLLLLLRTETYRAHAFFEAARAMRLDLTVGSERQQALSHLNPDGHLLLDLDDVPTALERIREFAHRRRIDAVVAADDDCALLAACACEELGLRFHPPAAVQAARDKRIARGAFEAGGLATPRFTLVARDGDPAVALAEWTARATRGSGGRAFPCVLKPRGLAASRGVIRADDADSFHAAFRRVGRLLARERSRGPYEPPPDSILVEQFVPGAEFALEGLMSAGALTTLAIFEKPDPMNGPFFEETIYLTPPRHGEWTPPLVEAAGRGARALGLTHGPIHAEFRCNEQGVWPLEIAPRSIGGLCSRALRFAGGETLESVLLGHALGRTDAPARESNASGVMMIPIPGAGRLRATHGADEARAVPGITELRLTIPIGSRLVPLPEGAEYLGFLFARGERPGDVDASLRAAHARLKFDIEPAMAGEETIER